MEERTPAAGDHEIIPDAPSDPDAFLVWSSELPREYGKVELSRGRVTKMQAGVTTGHSKVCTNIVRALLAELDPDLFDLSAAELGVRTPVGIRYPDIMVCPLAESLKALASTNPIFIAEVLSPSTEGNDFGPKADEYKGIATLQTYLICSQEQARVWLWARQPDGSWPAGPEQIGALDREIALGGLDLVLTLPKIYRGLLPKG